MSRFITMRWPEAVYTLAEERARTLGLSRTAYVVKLIERDATPDVSSVPAKAPRPRPARQRPQEAHERCEHPMWRRTKGTCMGCGASVK